jgi:hypothetical protein
MKTTTAKPDTDETAADSSPAMLAAERICDHFRTAANLRPLAAIVQKAIDAEVQPVAAELEQCKQDRADWANANHRQIAALQTQRAELNRAKASLESILANIDEPSNPQPFGGSTGAIRRMLIADIARIAAAVKVTP